MVVNSILETVHNQDSLLGKFSPQVLATIEIELLLIHCASCFTYVISFHPYTIKGKNLCFANEDLPMVTWMTNEPN